MEIIAEIGWNHLGDINLASKMISSAKKSGATIAKFQLWDPEIMKNGDWDNDGRIDIYKKAKLSDENILFLKNVCELNNIKILFSAFGTIGSTRLQNLKFDSIKIPSHEIANNLLLNFCSNHFNQIFLSSGASTKEEVLEACKIIKNGKKQKFFNLMHCVSSYPCEVENINLPRLNFLKDIHSNIGLSDHTSSVLVPGFSINYGVSVIEKHFTIDNNLEGRDNKFALNPDKFKKMVNIIYEANLANQNLGSDFQKTEIDIIKNYRGRWEPKDYE